MFFGKNFRHFFWGTTAGIALLLIYFAILTIANSFAHAVYQFLDFWPWISLLVIGFGVQVGLYSFVRTGLKERSAKGATAEIAAAGGVSTGSMIACCAHHVTDVLPIIGLSGAALFLSQYQLFFILIGVFSNAVGITMMLGIIQKHDLASRNSLLQKFLLIDMKKAKNITIAGGIFVLGIVFWMSATGQI